MPGFKQPEVDDKFHCIQLFSEATNQQGVCLLPHSARTELAMLEFSILPCQQTIPLTSHAAKKYKL